MMMSVRAGPYAAAPAAGPTTTEICGTRPEARVMAVNIRPTASMDSTPLASFAPPECHTPTTGHPRRTAISIASTMRVVPAMPSAPPIFVASVQYAITGAPSTRPAAVSTSMSPAGCSSSQSFPSKSCVSRSSGARRSTPATSGRGLAVASTVI